MIDVWRQLVVEELLYPEEHNHTRPQERLLNTAAQHGPEAISRQLMNHWLDDLHPKTKGSAQERAESVEQLMWQPPAWIIAAPPRAALKLYDLAMDRAWPQDKPLPQAVLETYSPHSSLLGPWAAVMLRFLREDEKAGCQRLGRHIEALMNPANAANSLSRCQDASVFPVVLQAWREACARQQLGLPAVLEDPTAVVLHKPATDRVRLALAGWNTQQSRPEGTPDTGWGKPKM
jgi:hypothetical protein